MEGVCAVAMCSSAMCEAVPQVQRRLLRVYLEWCAWKMRVDRVAVVLLMSDRVCLWQW